MNFTLGVEDRSFHIVSVSNTNHLEFFYSEGPRIYYRNHYENIDLICNLREHYGKKSGVKMMTFDQKNEIL